MSVVTPFGSDIFSLLGIKNISSWMKTWVRDYERALDLLRLDHPETLSDYPGVTSTATKFRLAGYSVQQYVTKTFKTGRRPVKAYEEIMRLIPDTVTDSLSEYFVPDLAPPNVELGHIPFLYSLVPLAQAHRVPIHALADTKIATGAQVRQVDEYNNIMKLFCNRLLANMGFAP